MAKDVEREYDIKIVEEIGLLKEYYYNAVILAVGHKEFITQDIKKFVCENGVIYDVKGMLPKEFTDGRL